MSLGSSLIKGSALFVAGVSIVLALQTQGDLRAVKNENKSTIDTLTDSIANAKKEKPKEKVIESAQKLAFEKTTEFLEKNETLVKTGIEDKEKNAEILKELNNMVVDSDTMALPLFGYYDYGWKPTVHVGAQDSNDRVNVVIDFNDKDGKLMASTLLRYSIVSKKLGSFTTFYTDAGKTIVQDQQTIVGKENE